MKHLGANARYFELRAKYKTARDIGEVINRSATYVKLRMVEGPKDFTDREKSLLGLGGTQT